MLNQKIIINADHCSGCGACIKSCPFEAMHWMSSGKVNINQQLCTNCQACLSACNQDEAIRVEEISASESFTSAQGPVWVMGELETDNRLNQATGELLGKARELAAELRVQTEAILIGSNLEKSAQQCLNLGADRVLAVSAPELERFDDQPYAAILARLIRHYNPEIVLGGATAVGRSLLPRTATLIGTGLTADCTELTIDQESSLLIQIRPAFGGNLLASIICPEQRPQMATVRPGVFLRPQEDKKRIGEIIHLSPLDSELNSALRYLGFRPRDRSAPGLSEAEIIVAAGIGVGGPEGVAQAHDLAHLLNGCLGASRAVVDAGWAEYSRQIGQTGVTVQPAVYIACGISGAIQHIVGMRNSERIIAINKDPEAPMLQYADLAIVGDVKAILAQTMAQLSSEVR